MEIADIGHCEVGSILYNISVQYSVSRDEKCACNEKMPACGGLGPVACMDCMHSSHDASCERLCDLHGRGRLDASGNHPSGQ